MEMKTWRTDEWKRSVQVMIFENMGVAVTTWLLELQERVVRARPRGQVMICEEHHGFMGLNVFA